MKKFLTSLKSRARGALAVAGLLVGSTALAEGESGSSIDLTVATTQLSSMVDALKGWLEGAAPKIAILGGAILLATLIWVAIKWVTRGAKKA